MIGHKIGQMKLEHSIKQAVFLAPKTYGYIDIDNKITIKIKGVNHQVVDENITMDTLNNLLIENNELSIEQKKWFKKVYEGNISITDVVYKLKITSNKREALYNSEFLSKGEEIKIYSNTKPYNYNDITRK